MSLIALAESCGRSHAIDGEDAPKTPRDIPGGRVVESCVEGQLPQRVFLVTTSDSLRIVKAFTSNCYDLPLPTLDSRHPAIAVISLKASSGILLEIDSIVRQHDAAVAFATVRHCAEHDDVTTPAEFVLLPAPVPSRVEVSEILRPCTRWQ